MKIKKVFVLAVCVVVALAGIVFAQSNDVDVKGDLGIYDGDSHYVIIAPADLSADRTLTARDSAGTLIISGDTFTGDATATLDTDGSTAVTLATEHITDTKCIYFEYPTASDDLESIWTTNGFAATITKVWCESDQTVNLDLQIDDGSPADVMGTDCVCDSTPCEDESGLTGSMADGDRLDLAVTSVSGSPTWTSVCWTYTK
jgi:hypothetical protein